MHRGPVHGLSMADFRGNSFFNLAVKVHPLLSNVANPIDDAPRPTHHPPHRFRLESEASEYDKMKLVR